MLCMAGFLTLRLSMCLSVSVSVNKISYKNIESIYFIFGGSLPCHPGRKLFDFAKKKKKKKKGKGVWGGGGGGRVKFWP